jgi:SAM-dependent methyltransferase
MKEEDQKTLWNGIAGRAWVDAQSVLDQALHPFEALLSDGHPSGARVLDVGCGTGATTLAAAERGAQCVGVDISEPMITAAKERAARARMPVTFVCADAATHAFEPASVDAIISRFGVMFFEDPVAAFANLRRAAVGGATLRFVAWRGPADNPFMTAAERAAAPLLPDIPPRRPGAPGQFAFADASRVVRILGDSGWSGIGAEPIDVACSFPASELELYFTRLGPLGRVLDTVDESTRGEIVAAVRAAFSPFVHGDEVRFVAGCWLVTARA